MSKKKILDHFHITESSLLGEGSEASVYAMDEERVIRIYNEGYPVQLVIRRNRLLHHLLVGIEEVSFKIPEPILTLFLYGHHIVVERRLQGKSVDQLLFEKRGKEREALIRAYLDAANSIGDLPIEAGLYGDLIRSDSIQREKMVDYLAERAFRSLELAGHLFSEVDIDQLVEPLRELRGKELVHLDGWAGNMMGVGGRVTAVIDFGSVAIRGDRRLDPLSAAAYLDPAIVPAVNKDDQKIVESWLIEHNLFDLYKPVRRWLAAFWSFAIREDPRLDHWCRQILLKE